MKKKLQLFKSYGKGDGDELFESRFVETQKEIDEIVNEYNDSSDYLSGEISFEEGGEIYIGRGGVDWDEPTGFTIILLSFEEEKEKIEKEIETLKNQLNQLEKDYE